MQKYNILELNEKLLPELQSIAEELGIKKVSSLKKEELVYRILDEQAISYAGIQAEKEKEKEAKKAERQTKAKKTKAAAPKGAKADAKTKVAAPATPVEASVEEVAPEAPEQPERKRRTRIDKKEKVAAAVVPVQKNEEAVVSKSPVSANAPVSETLVQVADATADVPAETVKPAAKKVVKKTDKPVEKPLLPPVVVESDNGELPAEIAPEVTEEPLSWKLLPLRLRQTNLNVWYSAIRTPNQFSINFSHSLPRLQNRNRKHVKNNLQPPSSRTILARITTDRTTRIIITISATTIITMLCRKNSMSLTVY